MERSWVSGSVVAPQPAIVSNPGSSPALFRTVSVARNTSDHYRATNARGGEIAIGTGDDSSFTPVELLLAAIAGCASIDVDHIVSKRAEPEQLTATVSGNKIRDEQGNRMVNLQVSFDVTFPHGEAGDAARGVLQRAIDQSRDRLCTVGRTVSLPSPVEMKPAER